MARPTAETVQAAYDLIESYQRAMKLLDAAYTETESEPEHVAEDDCSSMPLDKISDAQAALSDRIDALRGWLGVHDREAA